MTSRAPTRPRPRPGTGTAAAGVLVAVLALVPLLRSYLIEAPAPRLVDLEVYREAGRSLLSGRPVYGHLTDPPHLLPFTYPPVAALAAVPLAVLPERLVDWLWTFAQVAALALVVRLAFRAFLDRFGSSWPLAAGALVGACSWLLPVRDGYMFGQVDVFLVAMCLVGVVRTRVRGDAGAWVGLATAVKLTPGVFAVHLWLSGRQTAAAWALGTAAALTLAAALAAPETSLNFWAGAVFDADRLGANAGTANQSLRGVVLRVGPDDTAGTLLWLVLAAAVAVWGFRTARRFSSAGDDVGAVAVVGLLAVLLSPVGWIHHLAWVVVALAAVVGDGRSTRRWLLTTAVWLWFTLPLPWWGIELIGTGNAPYSVGRTLQQFYCVGALLLLALLARLPRSVGLDGGEHGEDRAHDCGRTPDQCEPHTRQQRPTEQHRRTGHHGECQPRTGEDADRVAGPGREPGREQL